MVSNVCSINCVAIPYPRWALRVARESSLRAKGSASSAGTTRRSAQTATRPPAVPAGFSAGADATRTTAGATSRAPAGPASRLAASSTAGRAAAATYRGCVRNSAQVSVSPCNSTRSPERTDRVFLRASRAANAVASLTHKGAPNPRRTRSRTRRHLAPQQIRCGFVTTNSSRQTTHGRTRTNGLVDPGMPDPVPWSVDFGRGWAASKRTHSKLLASSPEILEQNMP